MHKDDTIEPSHSLWASPVIVKIRMNHQLTFCVDYRQLNNVTKNTRNRRHVGHTICAKKLSTLDLKSCYWRVAIDQKYTEKIAFSIGSYLWQFTVMSFRLCIASATFERLVEEVLNDIVQNTCSVYLDYIIGIGRNFEESRSIQTRSKL